MKYLFLLFTLFCLNQSNAQSNGQVSLDDTQNSSVKAFHPLYKTVCLGWIRNYAIRQKADSCLLAIDYYLKEMKDSAEIADILAITEVDENISDPRWLNLRAQLLKDLPQHYPPTLNATVFVQLIRFAHQDQFARLSSYTLKSEKPKAPLNEKILDTLNLKHLHYLDSLLSHNFKFSDKTVGDGGMEALFLFIQHCEDTVRQTGYLSLMRQWADSGALKKSFYASFIDRIRVRHHQPQLYGTHYWTDTLANKLVLYPIEDIGALNSSREAMGMESIQTNLITVERIEKKKFRKKRIEGREDYEIKGKDTLIKYVLQEWPPGSGK